MGNPANSEKRNHLVASEQRLGQKYAQLELNCFAPDLSISAQAKYGEKLFSEGSPNNNFQTLKISFPKLTLMLFANFDNRVHNFCLKTSKLLQSIILE